MIHSGFVIDLFRQEITMRMKSQFEADTYIEMDSHFSALLSS